jgi:hypothetical protein
MKKITSYEHACEVLGIKPEDILDVSRVREKDQKAFIDLFKLSIIIEANNKLNEWEIDWEDSNQEKYYPWMWVVKDNERPSGLGLSYSDCVSTRSGTDVGSRLSVGTENEAEYIGKDFMSLYESWLLI